MAPSSGDRIIHLYVKLCHSSPKNYLFVYCLTHYPNSDFFKCIISDYRFILWSKLNHTPSVCAHEKIWGFAEYHWDWPAHCFVFSEILLWCVSKIRRLYRTHYRTNLVMGVPQYQPWLMYTAYLCFNAFICIQIWSKHV